MFPSGYEWDENKRKINIEKHGLDFYDTPLICQNPIIKIPSQGYGEERYMVIGFLCVLGNKKIPATFIYTPRNTNKRIISLRVARPLERTIYFKKTNIRI